MTEGHKEIILRFARLQTALQNADNQYHVGSKQMAIAHLRRLQSETSELINYLSHAHEISYLNEQARQSEAQKIIEGDECGCQACRA